MSTVSNSVNSINSVNSVNSYSAVLPPSPMVFLQADKPKRTDEFLKETFECGKRLAKNKVPNQKKMPKIRCRAYKNVTFYHIKWAYSFHNFAGFCVQFSVNDIPPIWNNWLWHICPEIFRVPLQETCVNLR